MESPPKEIIPTSTRIVLVLGKFRVMERNESTMKIALGGSTTMTVNIPWEYADIRAGDLLTLYTEVLTKGILDAPPVPAPE